MFENTIVSVVIATAKETGSLSVLIRLIELYSCARSLEHKQHSNVKKITGPRNNKI
jgi:hypothetical protein